MAISICGITIPKAFTQSIHNTQAHKIIKFTRDLIKNVIDITREWYNIMTEEHLPLQSRYFLPSSSFSVQIIPEQDCSKSSQEDQRRYKQVHLFGACLCQALQGYDIKECLSQYSKTSANDHLSKKKTWPMRPPPLDLILVLNHPV